ncbi:MAG: hypothetical protein ACLFRV_03280 [Acidimicrobiales bacterium]
MSDNEPTRDTGRVAEDVAAETSADAVEPVAPERTELPPLKALNAFATYDDPQLARDAVVSLERAGIDGANISALALDTSGRAGSGDESSMGATVERDREVLGKLGSDVGHGAAIGAVAGALGGAAIAVAVPGLGTALGAGMLAIAAGGAAAGTSVGGFAGAVAGTPTSPGWEQALIDLDDGRVVVGVHHDDRDSHDTAVAALEGTGALSLRCVDPDGHPC